MTSATAVADQLSLYRRPPFAALDKLAIAMMSESTGVPSKQQKYFRQTLPQSFTGAELIQWLVHTCHLDDTAEGIHMATILLEHGYLFPVIDRYCGIKDDSTLYRFQAPYFWASHSSSPDDIEYAIYLARRLLRNETRHGLEEHETEAYNRLCDLHGNRWDYISMQAEMQLKLHKEKKKSEKVVIDSQERAYWLLQRPPSKNRNNFEEQQTKLKKRVRRKLARHWEIEIDILKLSLKTKRHFKTSTQGLVKWTEQIQEHDPLIVNCHPSNPWQSDETTFWAYNADLVDVPTEGRVKRWALSVIEVINDPIGRQVFESFLAKELSSENINFWIAVQELKWTANSEVEEKVDDIYQEFLASGAPCQVNIEHKCLETVIANMKQPADDAEDQVFNLMTRDSYSRFAEHEIYKSILAAAKAQGQKRQGWKAVKASKSKPYENIIFSASGSGAGGTTSKRSMSAAKPVQTTSTD